MKKIKRWRVILDAEKPPACGDWVAVNGMGPGEEEKVEFTFLDGTEGEGFTFRNEVSVGGRIFCADRLSPDAYVDEVPWLHFSDCMNVVGVERLDWQPAGWSHEKTLWQLTVESLPSNIEFEKRFIQGRDRRRDSATGGRGWLTFRR